MIARLLSLILQPANINTARVTAKIGLLHLKSVPPGWGLTFSSYPLRLAKIAFTPEDFRKIWVYPWRIGSYPWRIWVYPWRILWKLRLYPQKMPYFLTLTLKKSSIFITYPGEFHGSSTGGVRILNAIAHYEFYVLTIKNASSAGNWTRIAITLPITFVP